MKKCILMFLLLPVMISCSGPDFKIINVSGVILSEETNKPISDVLVYAQWESHHSGGIGHGSSWSECKKVDLYVTNQIGEFDFNGFIGAMGSLGRAEVYVYKLGYEIKRIYNGDVDTIKLKVSNETVRERIDNINKMFKKTSCVRPYSKVFQASREQAAKLVSSIFNEIHKLVYTEDDLENVIGSYCYRIAEIELGNRLVTNSGWSGSEDKRGKQTSNFIKANYKECDMKYLQNIRKNNLYALLKDSRTRFGDVASISGCIEDVSLNRESATYVISGGGVFTLQNVGYLDGSNESIYLPLSKLSITATNFTNILTSRYGVDSRNTSSLTGFLYGYGGGETTSNIELTNIYRAKVATQLQPYEKALMKLAETNKTGRSDEYVNVYQKYIKVKTKSLIKNIGDKHLALERKILGFNYSGTKLLNIKVGDDGVPLSMDMNLTGLRGYITTKPGTYVDYKNIHDKDKYHTNYSLLRKKNIKFLRMVEGTLHCQP